MSNDKVLLRKYETQMRDAENRIKKLEGNVRSYGFSNCRTAKDFEREKSKLELELNNVKKDILKAGSKYDSSLVVALKNREGRIKTKLNDVNDVFVLFDRINELKGEISDIEYEIKRLIDKIKPVDNEREQMNIVLKALRKNYSYEDAANLANVEMKRMVNWIHEGRGRTNKNKIYFFKQFSKIKSSKKRKIDKILTHLENGKTKDEACRLAYVSVDAFDRWYAYGMLGKDRINVDFYRRVKLINEKRLSGCILSGAAILE